MLSWSFPSSRALLYASSADLRVVYTPPLYWVPLIGTTTAPMHRSKVCNTSHILTGVILHCWRSVVRDPLDRARRQQTQRLSIYEEVYREPCVQHHNTTKEQKGGQCKNTIGGGTKNIQKWRIQKWGLVHKPNKENKAGGTNTVYLTVRILCKSFTPGSSE